MENGLGVKEIASRLEMNDPLLIFSTDDIVSEVRSRRRQKREIYIGQQSSLQSLAQNLWTAQL